MGNQRRKGQSKQLPSPAACLSEAAGFRVETSQGLLGLVEELRCHSGVLDLVVRAGKQGARRASLTLRVPFRLTGSERLSARAGPAAIPGAL
jgi:hypothetical protein